MRVRVRLPPVFAKIVYDLLYAVSPGSEGQNGKERTGRWIREREPKAASGGPHAVL